MRYKKNQTVIVAIHTAGLPITFIFNPKSKLVFSEMGYRKWDSKEHIDLFPEIIK